MKKYLILVLLISNLGYSQSIKREKISFGFDIGSVTSKAKIVNSSIDLLSTSFRQGFKIGLCGRGKIGKNFYLEPEINFIHKSGDFSYNYQGQKFDDVLDLNFIEFPMNLIFRNLDGNNKFFGGIGYVASLGLNGSLKETNNNVSRDYKLNFWSQYTYNSNNANNEIYMNSLEHSISFIAGMQIAKDMDLKLNYNFSIPNFSTVVLQAAGYNINKYSSSYIGLTLL